MQAYSMYTKNKHKKKSNGLVQDCGNSIVLAMELAQSCIKPLQYFSLAPSLRHIQKKKSTFVSCIKPKLIGSIEDEVEIYKCIISNIF